MTDDGHPVHVQFAAERAADGPIETLQIGGNEFQVIQANRQCKSERLVVFDHLIAEMTAKARVHKSSVGELNGRRLVGMIHGSDNVTAAGEILEEECVIGECACIAV